MGTVFAQKALNSLIDVANKFTGVTTVGGGCFSGTVIDELVFPVNTVTVSANAANGNAKLYCLVIPSKVTSIAGNLTYYRLQLKATIFLPEDPPVITSSTFNYTTGKVYVPDVNHYKTADVWRDKTLYDFTQLAIDYPDYYEKYVSHS